MDHESLPNPDQSSRLRRVASAISNIMGKMGQGFEQDNKSLELGSREDRIVATTKIPDHLPTDW